MLDGKYKRNQEAQLDIANFKFKDLSITLAKEWLLPEPIVEIIDYANHTHTRAKVAKTCVDLARHIYEPKGYLAIPDDIEQLHNLTHLNAITDIIGLLNLTEHLHKDQLYCVVKNSKNKDE
jgi:HD-like signal output (HDOD) protein